MGHKIGLREAMGMIPLKTRLKEATITFLGGEALPKNRMGMSSLGQLRPRIGLALWRRRHFVDRQIIVTNLFNHSQTPIEDGWSVRMTQLADFRGGKLTYDSHNGTDLSIPIGSTVVAPAAGVVGRISREFNRGGLKIFIDHGEGLVTNCAHLGRALVAEGQIVARGEPIAISGYSGVDGLTTFPFGTPHVHFNVWLNGEPVDPFARPGETSMWRAGEPSPTPRIDDEPFEPSPWDASGVEALIAGCRYQPYVEALRGIDGLAARGINALALRNYFPTRFSESPRIFAETFDRSERLSLPFCPQEFDGLVFADAL